MKYHIITLGCPKNTVDSEGMSGILAAQGHTAAASPGDADVVIVNTCSFIAAARDETLGVLHDIATSKAPGQRLIAAGCMAESHGALVQQVPGVDAILSTREWMKIGDVIAEHREPRTKDQGPAKSGVWNDIIPLTVGPIQSTGSNESDSVSSSQFSILNSSFTSDLSVPGDYADWRTAPIRRHAGGPSAYLKISDGCNLRCAFCTIPCTSAIVRKFARTADFPVKFTTHQHQGFRAALCRNDGARTSAAPRSRRAWRRSPARPPGGCP